MSALDIEIGTQNGTAFGMAERKTKYPPKEKLKQLRELRGLSMAKLAAKIGREAPLIYKLEKGITRYNETLLADLAAALDVSPAELLDEDLEAMPEKASAKQGFSEDAIPFDGDPKIARLPDLSPNEFVYNVRTRILDQIGIIPGDLLIIDTGQGFRSRLRDGDVVVAQIYEVADPMKATTVLRQFLAPSMLVSNSTGENPPPINTKSTGAALTGVMVSSHRSKPSRA